MIYKQLQKLTWICFLLFGAEQHLQSNITVVKKITHSSNVIKTRNKKKKQDVRSDVVEELKSEVYHVLTLKSVTTGGIVNIFSLTLSRHKNVLPPSTCLTD